MSRISYLDPESTINSAAHWRMRGEEIRTVAEDARDATAKAIMRRIAVDYERLAKWAEESEGLGIGRAPAVSSANSSAHFGIKARTRVFTFPQIDRPSRTKLQSELFSALISPGEALVNPQASHPEPHG
jgi:hypothetical protein